MIRILSIVLIPLVLMSASGSSCSEPAQTSNGIALAQAEVQTGPSGMTVEQENVKRRVEQDNKPGSVKYLYCLSAYSGEVIFQSTVQGKVSSGGKRLEPSEANAGNGIAFRTPAGWWTTETMQPDGTYGSSGDYVFWWDVQGVYHQHYNAGGQILHVSSQPMAFGRVTLDIQTEQRR